MRNQRENNKGRNPFLIIGLIIALALVVAIIISTGPLMDLYKQVQVEKNTTPSPNPTAGAIYSATLDPSLPSPTPTPMMLKNGSAGEEVRKLQQRLKDLGFYTGEVDGQFGNGTKNAVVWFQFQHGLDDDGIAGPATIEKVYSSSAQTAVATPTPTFTPTPGPTFTPGPTQDGSAMAASAGFYSSGYPILVNRTHPLPDGYTPKDLVNLNDVCPKDVVTIKGSDIQGEREAVNALVSMLTDAISQGVSAWQVSAGYRTVAYQQTLFDRQVAEYMNESGMSRANAVSATKKTVADPGTSEHHTGLAFDITTPGTYFKGTPQAQWLADNSWQYGFVVRYTEDKEDLTGFLAEPWHIRYVGEAHAATMHEHNWCLEEYLNAMGIITD